MQTSGGFDRASAKQRQPAPPRQRVHPTLDARLYLVVLLTHVVLVLGVLRVVRDRDRLLERRSDLCREGDLREHGRGDSPGGLKCDREPLQPGQLVQLQGLRQTTAREDHRRGVWAPTVATGTIGTPDLIASRTKPVRPASTASSRREQSPAREATQPAAPDICRRRSSTFLRAAAASCLRLSSTEPSCEPARGECCELVCGLGCAM